MEHEEKQDVEAGKPVVDVFGQSRNADGSVAVPETSPIETEKKEKPEKKIKVVDLDNHPVVQGLKKQLTDLEERNIKLESDRVSMGQSLVGQREKIDKIKEQMKEAESEIPYKNIQRTKDLTKEDLESMTEPEKRNMDAIADLQEKTNAQFLLGRKREIEAEVTASEATEQEDAATTFKNKVQTEAMKLAGDDKAMGNQIIENFNLFKDNDTLTGKALIERLTKAAAMTEGYKSPKEQKQQRGGAVATAGKTDDPFGTNQIIQDVQKKKSGTYDL